jgi:hypothetical protein
MVVRCAGFGAESEVSAPVEGLGKSQSCWAKIRLFQTVTLPLNRRPRVTGRLRRELLPLYPIKTLATATIFL